MLDFDRVIEKFRKNELNATMWNFCTHNDGDGTFSAYVMGEGAEQCLAHKPGFSSREEIVELFESLGAKYILRGVG